MKNIAKITVFMFLVFAGFYACKEGERFGLSSDDTTPPAAPEYLSYKPLYGGARLFYKIPEDEDILSINAEYTAASGKPAKFSVSYFVDSLDVVGFADSVFYDVQLYALDRAGNKSTPVTVSVKPLESAVSKVFQTLNVKPAFGSFYVDWKNPLHQTMNVFVNFDFTLNGEQRSLMQVFASNNTVDRYYVNDLALSPNDPINLDVWCEDMYGNKSKVKKETIYLYEDIELPKNEWYLPQSNDSIGGVPMAFGNSLNGNIEYIRDGIIFEGIENYCNMYQMGRTGFLKDGDLPWNIMIDLGDYYELSRIITHQRRYIREAKPYLKDALYTQYNVGIYNMYIWDEDTQGWEFVYQHKIPIPVGIPDMEIISQAQAGDICYMFPDNPGFTKPTRWFRYEALKGFGNNYSNVDAWCLAEMTLYGRKANK